MTVNNGRFVWYEHLAKDPKKAIDFYSRGSRLEDTAIHGRRTIM